MSRRSKGGEKVKFKQSLASALKQSRAGLHVYVHKSFFKSTIVIHFFSQPFIISNVKVCLGPFQKYSNAFLIKISVFHILVYIPGFTLVPHPFKSSPNEITPYTVDRSTTIPYHVITYHTISNHDKSCPNWESNITELDK